MTVFRFNRVFLVALALFVISTAAVAQDNGPDGSPSGSPEAGPEADGPAEDFTEPPFLTEGPEALPPKTETALSDAVTDVIVKELNDAAAFCGSVGAREYVVDCMAYEYERIAAALPDHGPYATVKRAVGEAAAEMRNVVRQTPSRTLPAGRLTKAGPKPRRTARVLRPVATEALPQATAAAAEIIGETQTVLLRSTENSEQRRRHFQRIVSAMDTGTILLRSI